MTDLHHQPDPLFISRLSSLSEYKEHPWYGLRGQGWLGVPRLEYRIKQDFICVNVHCQWTYTHSARTAPHVPEQD